jgi:uncharacterized protein with PIN domain
MSSVSIRFYGELNDFLPPSRRAGRLQVAFREGCTAKALIEDMGVPHTEVDLILANGESVDFSHRLADADDLAVYPVFESLDITAATRLRPHPLRVTRFVVDVHLGKLASLLRLFGFDAVYGNDWGDEKLLLISRGEARIVLTRDRGLLKRRALTHGYCVRSSQPRLQIAEVIRRFDLRGQVRLFSRCLACNAPLAPADPREVRSLVPPRVAELYGQFSRCPSCSRVYWRGTHWERLTRLAEEVLGSRG